MEKTRAEKISEILDSLKEPPFRLRQILSAIYREKILDYNLMSNLPLRLRQTLAEKLGGVLSLKVVKISDGSLAKKILFATKDGAQLETVITKTKPFVCLSSMSGCNLGCRFCSTASMGLVKLLTADEIIDQVLYFETIENFRGHITFMGMGEPLLNEANVFSALKILTDKNAFGYGQRKISLSTVGIIPGIIRLGKEFPQINLAFSLHSPFSQQRSKLMPVNKLYPLEKVMSALDHHLQITKRKVFIAYLMLNNVNDSLKHAEGLVKMLETRGKYSYLYHVNLIQFHSNYERFPFTQSSPEKLKAFSNFLSAHKVNFTLRKSFGEDIHAACGQLCLKNKPALL